MKYTEEIVKKVAKDAYLNGDVKFEIIAVNCALIVIDMQDEFVKPEWTSSWIPEATKQLSKIKKMIEIIRFQFRVNL